MPAAQPVRSTEPMQHAGRRHRPLEFDQSCTGSCAAIRHTPLSNVPVISDMA